MFTLIPLSSVIQILVFFKSFPDEQSFFFADPVLQYLLSGLQHPLLASVAATALQSISTQCRDLMIDHFQGLVQIVQAMDSFNLSSEAAIGLLKGELISQFTQ